MTLIMFDPAKHTDILNQTDGHISPCASLKHPYALGASLYMPATRHDIWQVVNRSKLETIDSVIVCLEDAVSEADVPMALIQLQSLLKTWAQHLERSEGDRATDFQRPLVFVRPRHPQMLMQLADFEHIELIDGFVLPKVDMLSLSNWRMACQYISADSLLMPTLETAAMFNPLHNQELAVALQEGFDQAVFALRIGGNDLFAALRMRRPHNSSVYDTAIGSLIYQLLGCFVPHGFYLTAPVFEYLDQPTLFMQELTHDVSLGLVGKTVIHPTQIPLVHQAFCVPASVHDEAKAILDSEAKAVFKYNNTMLEPATHRAWAVEVIERAQIFGVVEDGVGQFG
ncbi:MAG: HpcH/HpaI aldolase/citrate lyase family protein [Psychrobacter sp.]|nr:HpcH/HpaI aldolase/citrate lyase family protein [Psychrobacter sp.]